MSLIPWRIASAALAILALGGTVALVGAAGVNVNTPAAATGPAHPLPAPPPRSARVTRPADSLVVARNLFRVTRAPAPLPFDPRGGPPGAAPPEGRPALMLAGFVLGPFRAALIRGIPGHEAVQVLAEGEELSGLRVLRIDTAGAVLLWRSDTVRVVLGKEEP